MINVTEVKIRFANGNDKGLIGWASCVVNGAILLDNIAVMCSPDRGVMISFPANISRNSKKHFHFKPITHHAADILKKAIVKELQSVSYG